MSLDTHQSVYREQLLEHLLIGELLKHSWRFHGATLEVSQPAIDRSGHDIVLEANGVIRHVQLKTSSNNASTSTQKIHVDLARRESGCVIWIRFDPTTLELGRFHFFGSPPGEKLQDVSQLKIAKHTKANTEGQKLERPNFRIISRGMFTEIHGIEQLYYALFGAHK